MQTLEIYGKKLQKNTGATDSRPEPRISDISGEKDGATVGE